LPCSRLPSLGGQVARNDSSLRVFARHDSVEAISPSRCEGIFSFTIHNTEATLEIATHLSSARKDTPVMSLRGWPRPAEAILAGGLSDCRALPTMTGGSGEK